MADPEFVKKIVSILPPSQQARIIKEETDPSKVTVTQPPPVRQRKKRVTPISLIPTDKTLTPSQMELSLRAERIVIEEQIKQIKPQLEYYTEADKKRHMPGWRIREVYYDPYFKYLEETQKWTKKIPPGYIIKRTETGYEAVPPPLGTVEKELFYSMHPGEQHISEVAGPTAQLVTGIGALLKKFTGGIIEIRTPSIESFGGRSVFIHGGSVAPTLFDVAPWTVDWRREWFFQRVKESPFSLVTMGAGEGVLFAGFGLVTKPISTGVKTGVKFGVRKIPKIYETVKTKFPILQTYVTEGGKVVATRPALFISRLGRTPFYQHLSGWSTGYLSRVKTIPLVSRTVTPGKGYVETYKPWGKIQWIPKSQIKYVGTEYGAGIRYTHMGAESTAYSEMIKPRGRLWWKKLTRQYVYHVETRPFVFESGVVKPMGVGEQTFGVVKPWSTRISTGAERIRIADTGGFIRPDYIVTKGKQIKLTGFWKDTGAMQRLVPGVHRPVMPSGIHHAGFLGQPSISIPATWSIPSIGFEIGLISGVTLLSQLGIKSMYKPDIKSAQHYAIDMLNIQLTGQDQIQGLRESQDQIYRQMQKQDQVLIQATTPYKATRSKSPHVSYPITIPIKTKIPKPFILPDEFDKKLKKKLFDIDILGKGYRIRKWKTPKMKEIVPVPNIEKITKKIKKLGF